MTMAALCFAVVALADPGNNPNHAKLSYTVSTQDHGTCNYMVWANDAVKRTWEVTRNDDGSYTVTRTDRGRFTTLAGKSPGACEPGRQHGRTVRAGVKGIVVGYLRGTVTGATFDPKATCTGTQCGTNATFLATFFGADAIFSCDVAAPDCTYNFNYTAAYNQRLKYRHWQDKGKGADEEFHGDIADA